ncbi:MAG: formylglycine-generating enzyme family protein [Bacteroidales bacterium]|nr:formylglycine-generating enzyme family protein [Bacteroidales bacterium]
MENNVLTVFANGVFFKMIPVQGGTFLMGDTIDQNDMFNRDAKPVHEVTLSDYYIGETVVTQALWKAVMGRSGKNNKYRFLNSPVCDVDYFEITRFFLPKLKYFTLKKFRLPTEAEWEYAARGGKSGGAKYSGSDKIDEVAWYGKRRHGCRTHSVMQKKPNALGLYDMSGNVWEWCDDRYGDYVKCPQVNPKGGFDKYHNVIRGGCVHSSDYQCCVYSRYYHCMHFSDSFVGFRLALSC